MFPAPGRFLAVSALAVLTLGTSAPAAAQPPQKNPEPPPKSPQPTPKELVRGEGCVQAGLQPHCLILRDIKSGHVYDLLFKADPPPIGLGIEFTGVPHPGPTSCMQGAAVEVTTWGHKSSMKCGPGQSGKHGRSAAH